MTVEEAKPIVKMIARYCPSWKPDKETFLLWSERISSFNNADWAMNHVKSFMDDWRSEFVPSLGMVVSHLKECRLREYKEEKAKAEYDVVSSKPSPEEMKLATSRFAEIHKILERNHGE